MGLQKLEHLKFEITLPIIYYYYYYKFFNSSFKTKKNAGENSLQLYL